MNDGNDGGRRALAGFLYQAVGVGGLVARAWLSDPGSSPGELGLLLELARDGVVEQEAHGQDAAITGVGWDGNHERVLVQFKYSSQPLTHAIQPAELLGIARAFRRSERAANERQPLATGFALVSNRELSPESQECMRAARSEAECPSLGKPTEMKAERDVLRSLLLLPVNEAQWIDELARMGNRLGLSGREFDDGMGRLVGRLVRDAASGHSSFTAEDLASELAGFSSPRTITRERLREVMAADINDFRTAIQLPFPTLRRAVARELEDLSQHALFMLHGDGGCGKSTTICHVLEDALQPGSPAARHYAVADFGAQLPQSWVSETVGKWRGSPSDPYYAEPQVKALDRLERAHGSSDRPILVLAIDGLDEALAGGPDAQQPIRRIFGLVSDEHRAALQASGSPRVVLLVTCRSRTDLSDVWPLSQARFPAEGEGLKEIPVLDFTADELVGLARRSTPDPVAERIARMAGHDSPSADAPGIPVDLLRPASPRPGAAPLPVSEEVYAALKHPLLWRFFAPLPEEIQHRVLGGDREALWRLCESYRDWFYEKARRRRPAFNREGARAMLTAIARAFGDPGRIGRCETDWIRPATADGRFGSGEALSFFREADSFGLVKEIQAGTWRWRHPFMCEYLASREEGG